MLCQLTKLEMKGSDISDDELAKSHARYMIGGRVDVPDERIFRFGKLVSISLSHLPLTGVYRIP